MKVFRLSSYVSSRVKIFSPFGKLFWIITLFPVESVYLNSVSKVCPNAVNQIVNSVKVVNRLIRLSTICPEGLHTTVYGMVSKGLRSDVAINRYERLMRAMHFAYHRNPLLLIHLVVVRFYSFRNFLIAFKTLCLSFSKSSATLLKNACLSSG